MNVAVVGAGSWGTAMAGQIAPRAGKVTLWAHSEAVAAGIRDDHANPRYLTDYRLPDNVTASSDIAEALAGSDAVVFAVPSAHLRSVCSDAAPHLAAGQPVLCLTKGIEPGTGLLMSDLIADEVGSPERVMALSGPNHAEEVCRGGLSAAVIASPSQELAETFKSLILSPEFRVYVSDDMVGVEMCGAVKNVIAIVCGISVGLGYGDNTLALIMTRGLAEISRLVAARGGNPMTCMGLAGMGDLIATCTSKHSRNRTFGEAFAHGTSLEEYERRTHMVVEGARAAMSVSELARRLSVDAPITFALHDVLWGDGSLGGAFDTLLHRIPTEEFYGL